ncbi:hypothetical protein HYS94_02170 [Candidatus Daviesbacteria bacterium]|nr:hypothetical protein [Candidatus Daviesbacteria bacterium]
MGCKCDGTGHVYLLDPDGEFELRVKCPNWKLRHSVQGSAYGCGVCENRGWIPTDDPWAYVRAAVHIYRPLGEKDFDLKTALETAFKQWLWSWEDPDPGEAAFKVVVEALLKISVSEPRRIMIIKKIIDMGHG